MTARAHLDTGPLRFVVRRAERQAEYQLLLLARSEIGVFTTLVVPMMLLLVLDLAGPHAGASELHGMSYASFITPAMITFAILNACYVNVLTSVVMSREDGILKRLHGTPMPLSSYVLGRMIAAAAVALLAVAVLLPVGTFGLGASLPASGLGELAGVVALGVLVFTTVGVALTSIVPRADTALPIAFGTMLPLAFISGVFFPSEGTEPWLRRVGDAFPIAPIARSAARVFSSRGGSWPMTGTELGVLLGWLAGAAVVSTIAFRWQPGESVLRSLREAAPIPHRTRRAEP